MDSFDALAYNHAALDEERLGHLRKLISCWGMLSDLCFADLLLFVPLASTNNSRFVVLGQARPTTAQTFHLDVLVGRVVDEFERPMIARAWRRKEIVEAEDVVLGRGERARMQCIPVVYQGEAIAVLSRESPLVVGRRPGQLEKVYIDVFHRFAQMIIRGQFPFEDDIWDKFSPRIGDGSLVLDKERRITFASPNAMNAMHRMGFIANVVGSRFEDIGIRGHLIKQTYETARPHSDEVEPRLNVSLAMTCVPLLSGGEVDGSLVIIRDVSDLRRLDRLLLSKDATIREIHHRVKNNLQTITSLLDLQARRLEAGPARTALEEAHRRVRSIALVHEILSRDSSELIQFNEIIEPLVRVAAQTALVADHNVEFDVDGDAGELESSIATPLAVVVAEILANAVEHAFPDGKTSNNKSPLVKMRLQNDGTSLHVVISDNGMGIPEGFSIHNTRSLGLSITCSLVESQLRGHIEMYNEKGCVVKLSVPVKAAE